MTPFLENRGIKVILNAIRDNLPKQLVERPAYGCFMMGPSATADVEATLVHGAQEARSLNVFFLLRTVSV